MSDSKLNSGELPTGSAIGILGGGQLGRMTAMDAARLGYTCHIFSPSSEFPASHVSHRETIASYDDHDALDAFIAAVDVVTVETEHIPATTLQYVEERSLLYPPADCVAICQHRVREKSFIDSCGARTARWEPRNFDLTLCDQIRKFGFPCIIKTATGGYDGHGQTRFDNESALDGLAPDQETTELILEEVVDFDFEVSVIVARGARGEVRTYPTVRNEHRNHILWQTHAPAELSEVLDNECRTTAAQLSEAMDLTGLLAVEFFVTNGGTILVNEMAPRPHNSGHWTMDACQTPQFEQLVRAVSGLPLGGTEMLHPARMTNLLGDAVLDRVKWCEKQGAHIHLYGKSEIRSGRKMGHVNEVFVRHDSRFSR